MSTTQWQTAIETVSVHARNVLGEDWPTLAESAVARGVRYANLKALYDRIPRSTNVEELHSLASSGATTRDGELLALMFQTILQSARSGRTILSASPAALSRMDLGTLCRIGLLHLMQLYPDNI